MTVTAVVGVGALDTESDNVIVAEGATVCDVTTMTEVPETVGASEALDDICLRSTELGRAEVNSSNRAQGRIIMRF